MTARNSEGAETVSTLVHSILLAQADLVDIEAAARRDRASRLLPAPAAHPGGWVLSRNRERRGQGGKEKMQSEISKNEKPIRKILRERSGAWTTPLSWD